MGRFGDRRSERDGDQPSLKLLARLQFIESRKEEFFLPNIQRFRIINKRDDIRFRQLIISVGESFLKEFLNLRQSQCFVIGDFAFDSGLYRCINPTSTQLPRS